MTLEELGWTTELASAFAPLVAQGLEPARVVCELRRKFYAVRTVEEELLGECRGRFFHEARRPEEFPAIGDWVAVRRRGAGESRCDIHALLPRRTKLSRRAAGTEEIEQILAANIDTVLVVAGLDANFNPQRIQRMLVAAKESGAEPVVVLNKSDVCEDAEGISRQVEALVPGIVVYLTSAVSRKGVKALAATYAKPGRTLVLLGSSGVGKSSLINRLARDADLPTTEVREKDSKGRHTTTRRELVFMPNGAMVIDTPGVRELQLWDAGEAVEDLFGEIRALALRCRFSDCAHGNEPGCAVRAAIATGELEEARLAAYQKFKAEQGRPKREKKPGALASKPGWKNQIAPEGPKHFRQWTAED
jgi:ribosome biogenesis GTPase